MMKKIVQLDLNLWVSASVTRVIAMSCPIGHYWWRFRWLIFKQTKKTRFGLSCILIGFCLPKPGKLRVCFQCRLNQIASRFSFKSIDPRQHLTLQCKTCISRLLPLVGICRDNNNFRVLLSTGLKRPIESNLVQLKRHEKQKCHQQTRLVPRSINVGIWRLFNRVEVKTKNFSFAWRFCLNYRLRERENKIL